MLDFEVLDLTFEMLDLDLALSYIKVALLTHRGCTISSISDMS